MQLPGVLQPKNTLAARPLGGVTEFDNLLPCARQLVTSGVLGCRKQETKNHMAATALHLAYYNFFRVHQTLRVIPAMEARLTDHVWSLEGLVGLLDRRSAVAA